MSDCRNGCAGDGGVRPERDASIDVQLARPMAAINRAHQTAASALAGQVLEIDRENGVSGVVELLVRNSFELQACPPAVVKGVEGPIACRLVMGERANAARVGVGRGPVVDCERELARLQRSWAPAHAGTLRTPGVVYRGEPDIGKSRLAASAVELAEGSAAAAIVVELLRSPFHTDVGLHPLRTLIERRCDIAWVTDAAQRLLAKDRTVVCAQKRADGSASGTGARNVARAMRRSQGDFS